MKCQPPILSCFPLSLQRRMCHDKAKVGKGPGRKEGRHHFLVLAGPRFGPSCSQLAGALHQALDAPSGSSVTPGCLPVVPFHSGHCFGILETTITHLLILKKITEPYFFPWLFKYIPILNKGQGSGKKIFENYFIVVNPILSALLESGHSWFRGRILTS